MAGCSGKPLMLADRVQARAANAAARRRRVAGGRIEGNAVFKRRKPEEGAGRQPGPAAFPDAPEPFAPHPFAPEPFVSEPFAPGSFAPGSFAPGSFAPGSFAPEPVPPGGQPPGHLRSAEAGHRLPEGVPQGRLADDGLGVPPFRPAQPKEASMARPSLPTPNAPAIPQPGGMGALHNGGQGPGTPGYGTPPSGQGRPAPARPQPQGSERRTLVVGRGIAVQGTVQDAERLVVEGTVEASLIKATELSIALGGLFKGEVEVTDAEVAGTIDGTLTASGNLIVRATGKVLGVARCRRLQVEDGGAITGRIEMLTDGARVEAPRAEMAETVS